jgi:hypothetical protein
VVPPEAATGRRILPVILLMGFVALVILIYVLFLCP